MVLAGGRPDVTAYLFRTIRCQLLQQYAEDQGTPEPTPPPASIDLEAQQQKAPPTDTLDFNSIHLEMAGLARKLRACARGADTVPHQVSGETADPNAGMVTTNALAAAQYIEAFTRKVDNQRLRDITLFVNPTVDLIVYPTYESVASWNHMKEYADPQGRGPGFPGAHHINQINDTIQPLPFYDNGRGHLTIDMELRSTRTMATQTPTQTADSSAWEGDYGLPASVTDSGTAATRRLSSREMIEHPDVGTGPARFQPSHHAQTMARSASSTPQPAADHLHPDRQQWRRHH